MIIGVDPAQTVTHAAIGRPVPPEVDPIYGRSRREAIVQALRGCTLWLWLDLRFPGAYGHVDNVLALRSHLNDGIEQQLNSKRRLAQNKNGQRRGGQRG